MHPYLEQGFFSFIVTLWQRFFLCITGVINPDQWVSEDLQFFALILSGFIGLFLGFFLVYNKMTMIANSLSHTILLGLTLTFISFKFFFVDLRIDNMPFYILLIASLVTSCLTLMFMVFLSRRISEEAANAFSFTALFALGILITSTLLKNTHLGIESVLGNLEAIGFRDVWRLGATLLLVIAFFVLFQTRLLVASFDSVFAESVGVKVGVYKQVLVLIASICLMVCFRSLGVILILSLLTAPVLTAGLFYQDRKKLFLLGSVLILCQATLCLGLVQALYYHFDLPVSTSGLFGFLGLLEYLVALGIKQVICTSGGRLKLKALNH